MEPYHAIGVAILDAGLICSASIPCPAEMGGSIHIHGTGSSIVDTIFVCRDHGKDSDRYRFANFTKAQPLFRCLARLGRGKVIRVSVLRPGATLSSTIAMGSPRWFGPIWLNFALPA